MSAPLSASTIPSLSLIPEAYQSKTVRPRPNCSRETIANPAARIRRSRRTEAARDNV